MEHNLSEYIERLENDKLYLYTMRIGTSREEKQALDDAIGLIEDKINYCRMQYVLSHKKELLKTPLEVNFK